MKDVLGSLPEVITAYKNYNLLVPTATDVQLNPFYKFHVEEVPVDLGENSGDIFKVGSVNTGKQDERGKDIWEDVYSLSKPLLNKMAMAAGIQFNPNSDKIGVIEYRGEMPYVLLPPFHTTVTAQITVTIDQDGNFMNAEPVDLNDKLTIIPVTEKSGSRTAGKEPHPLCDNLRYLAGDYTKYYKDDGICHELYISQLKEWVESEYCHEKVRAIYLYLKKNILISDLVDKKIIKLDEQNQIDDKENIQGIVQTKAFVRFIIRSSNSDLFELKTDECWKDRTLQDCYINYVRSREKEKGLCYLTGNMEAISYLHSKKIRNEGDGAKLISSNDSQNFTYRGRFVSKEEAFAVGNETSQKIHNALKWIIRKQGTFFDTLAVVTWESNRLGKGFNVSMFAGEKR